MQAFWLKKQLFLILLFIMAFACAPLFAITINNNDTIIKTVSVDSVKTNTDGAIKSKVKYNARDSMRLDIINQKMYLYGNAQVDYEDLSLKAGYIELDLKTNIVMATGLKDSTGKEIGTPEFLQKGQSFKSQKMVYNFQTKKGKITDVITKEADGYIHGENVKKDSNDIVYVRNGKYTTCDLEHPHFYINASKLKVIPNDKIITGPAYLVINDVPTPLAVPFGIFPNKRGQRSGIIIPTYGQSENLGFFLRDGGFYFGINDYMDAALRADIYSFGSWGVKGIMNYNKRYAFNGNLNVNFSHIRIGESDLPNSTLQQDFILRWTHSQDSKARPGSSFSANVNAGTSNYNRFNSYNANVYLNNTLQSSINYTKTWLGTPFYLTASARHSQNTQTKKIDINLPQIGFFMNRVFPFKNKVLPGSKWYEKIGINYSAELRNDISTYDSLFFKPAMYRNMQNGLRHNIPISTSLNVLKYFTLTPAINLTSSWNLQSTEKKYNADLKKLIADTVPKFAMAHEASFSANLNTKLYGDYVFRNKLLKQIRHQIIPNVSYSYRPDYGEPQWNYYKKVQADSTGKQTTYSIFENSIYGKPPEGQSSLLSWSVNNTIEAKVRNKKDSVTGIKKISIIDMFSISGNYNAAVNRFKWSNFNISGRTKLFNYLDVLFSGTIDPYQLNKKGKKIDTLVWAKDFSLGRLTNYSLALSTSLRSKTPDDKKTKTNDIVSDYMPFEMPWSLSVYYTFNSSKEGLESARESQSLMFNGELSLTKKWRISFNSGYDFLNQELTYTQFNITRDLHCWEMNITWVPFGFRQSYLININVKSSVLQDLRITRRKDWFDSLL